MDGSALTARVILLSLRLGALLFLFLLAAAVVPSAHADALSAVQELRQGGCGGVVPLARPLQRSTSLDRAAEQWASGSTLAAAAARSGFGQVPTGVHVRASDSAVLEVLRRTECREVTDRSARELGMFRRGDET